MTKQELIKKIAATRAACDYCAPSNRPKFDKLIAKYTLRLARLECLTK